MTADT